MAEVFVNSGAPDQRSHSAVSDLGLPCLPIILLGVFGLQWVNGTGNTIKSCQLEAGQFTKLPNHIFPEQAVL